jgi:hypothetical protein
VCCACAVCACVVCLRCVLMVCACAVLCLCSEPLKLVIEHLRGQGAPVVEEPLVAHASWATTLHQLQCTPTGKNNAKSKPHGTQDEWNIKSQQRNSTNHTPPSLNKLAHGTPQSTHTASISRFPRIQWCAGLRLGLVSNGSLQVKVCFFAHLEMWKFSLSFVLQSSTLCVRRYRTPGTRKFYLSIPQWGSHTRYKNVDEHSSFQPTEHYVS